MVNFSRFLEEFKFFSKAFWSEKAELFCCKLFLIPFIYKSLEEYFDEFLLSATLNLNSESAVEFISLALKVFGVKSLFNGKFKALSW